MLAAMALAGMMHLAGDGGFVVSWGASRGAGTYRVYWSTAPVEWTTGNMVQTTGLSVPDPAPAPLPGQVIYYVVTASNYYGESETEHGPIT